MYKGKPDSYYLSLDKRTKEYREYKAWAETQGESQGLGDTVQKVTRATGLDKIAKAILGEDCGCDERKEKLNELFPYKKPECLEPKEIEYLHKFFHGNVNQVTATQQRELVNIYNRVLHQSRSTSNCSSCVRKLVDDLRKIYLIHLEGIEL